MTLTFLGHPHRCVDNFQAWPDVKPKCEHFWYDILGCPDSVKGCTCYGLIESLSIHEMRQTHKRGCSCYKGDQNYEGSS